MLERKPVFPHVIEINHQAGQRLGCNVYLVYDGADWLLIDVGFEETVDEIVELIRQLDFPLSQCQTLIATHADVDHIQGLAKINQLLKTKITGHPLAAEPLATGDQIKTFAEIAAQNIHLAMPPVKLDALVDEGDTIALGQISSWKSGTRRATPTASSRFDSATCCSAATTSIATAASARSMLIMAATSRRSFARCKRIRASDVEWLLPSHGPIFRKNDALIDQAIKRLEGYLHMADFGTCAIDWPLMDEWDQELAAGKMPQIASASGLVCDVPLPIEFVALASCAGSSGYSLNAACKACRCCS